MGLTEQLIQQAIAPVQQLLEVTATTAGVSPDASTSPGVPTLPVQINGVLELLITLSGRADYPEVYTMRTGMQNDSLFRRLNLLEPRLIAAEQQAAGADAINSAQQALLSELSDRLADQATTTTEQAAYLDELRARLGLVKLDVQNLRLDLAANQAHDAEQDARLTAEETVSAAQALAVIALQQQQASTAAALAANAAADHLNAQQDAVTQATAAQALALGQAEHAANVAQQAQLDALAAQQTTTQASLAANTANDALLSARQAATEAQLVSVQQAQAALAAQQKADETNIEADRVAAQQAQATATQALTAATTAQARADQAETDAQAAKTAAATALSAAQTAQAKADADATAAAQALSAAQAAQATANQAATAAATAQATANSATTAASTAQASANAAKAAADAAQAKADADATAAATAQATANAAQQAATTNAAAITALQTALAGKLDAALVRRGSVSLPAVTIQVATPATVTVTFATPFADANYEVFLSKPGTGLLGVELGWVNKTASGYTITERNTGAVSLVVPASTADYFALHN